MSLIKALIGRRQFLAASVASTCALTCKKLAGFEAAAAQAAAASAAAQGEPAESTSAILGIAGKGCPNLLSPLKIRDKVLKNRIYYTVAGLFTFQGPENYPADIFRRHFASIARNAAVVTLITSFGKYPKTYHGRLEDPDLWSWEHISTNKWENIPPTWNYWERMMDDMHYEGALVLLGDNTGDAGDTVVGGDVNGEGSATSKITGGSGRAAQGGQPGAAGGPGEQAGTGGAAGGYGLPGVPSGPSGPLPGIGVGKSIAEVVRDAKDKENLGYDIYPARSVEEAKAVREATNLLVVIEGGGNPMGGPGGRYPSMGAQVKPTAAQIEAQVEAARKYEGIADIYLMRGGGTAGGSWETGGYQEGAAYYYAQAMKKAGLKIVTCIGNGMHHPLMNDMYIAKGVTDMVAMTRPFYADEDLIKKVSAGQADEVAPCLMCQNCHSESMAKGPHISRCTVNPAWGQSPHMLAVAQTAPRKKKKVAVIGGGPAGMKAALVLTERGHKVTLYEKEAVLGGQQAHTDHSQWVWTYKNYKDYLIHMAKKNGIEVKLNTKATKEMIAAGGYDTVLVAVGSEISKPQMAGADAANVFDLDSCYSKKKQLGESVVVVGSGKLGVEAAIAMCLDGHKVTVLAGDAMFGKEDIGAHNVTAQTTIYRNHPNFKYTLNTTVTDITGGKVTYKDKDGNVQSVQADSIVFGNPPKPRQEEAASFAGAADEVRLIGDCTGTNGRLITATRSAYWVAVQV
jgi:thioredoxin reductase/2,4-dienoyl-CoA reductase-like NADH-dependent reductase (Old Yellow Enzyme family)